MRRILRTAAIPALALAVFGGAGTAAAATAAHPTAGAAACSGTIDITRFAFPTPTVTPGQTAGANLTAVNCTAQSVATTVVSYGRFLSGSGTGIPPGCPVIDPLAQPVTFAPNGQYTSIVGSIVFPSCTATAFEAIVMIEGSNGTVLAQATAEVTIVQTPPPVACKVTYTNSSEWRGGFVASIAITNTGTVPVNGWTLTYVYTGDEHISDVWNATGSQTGATVTLTNASFDPTIAPGSTLTGVGLLGTWTTSDGAPTDFTLNGAPCG